MRYRVSTKPTKGDVVVAAIAGVLFVVALAAGALALLWGPR